MFSICNTDFYWRSELWLSVLKKQRCLEGSKVSNRNAAHVLIRLQGEISVVKYLIIFQSLWCDLCFLASSSPFPVREIKPFNNVESCLLQEEICGGGGFAQRPTRISSKSMSLFLPTFCVNYSFLYTSTFCKEGWFWSALSWETLTWYVGLCSEWHSLPSSLFPCFLSVFSLHAASVIILNMLVF